jgi:small subunit ribosomal protein S7
VGGQKYQVPVAVNRNRQQSLAFRWILEAARGKTGKLMCERLAEKFNAASRREGAAIVNRKIGAQNGGSQQGVFAL